MTAPAVLLVAAIYLYPAATTVILSLSEFDLARLSITRFVGLENFRELVTSPSFLSILARTVYFGLVVVAATTVLAFLIALLLNEQFIGRSLLRVVVLLPWAVPPVVAGVLFGQLFHAEIGLVNALLQRLGLIDRYQVWLADPTVALHIIVLVEVWRALPFMILFFLAGLQSLPSDVFEAASIDGASLGQRLRHVLLPLVMPIAIPLMMLQFVWAMKAFDSIFVLTRGGPGRATTTLNYFVYTEGFQFFDLGRASAAAYVLLAVTLLVVAVLMLLRQLLGRRGFIDA
jgi:multiple sugar transport system permease protein